MGNVSVCKQGEPVHIWKGNVAPLACALSVYLTESPITGTKVLLILCDYKDRYYTPYSIDRLNLVFTTEELQAAIDDGKLIPSIIDAYLLEESTTRQEYGLTLH